MAQLNVSVFVNEVSENQQTNSYTATIVLAQGDVSGLSNLNLSFSGTLPPRYQVGATGTLVLP